MTTWFCDAYASWQKGGIENANGRPRRWLPRHLEIDRTSDQDIQEIVLTTNLTPRKCLGFKTPFQALLAELGKDVQFRFLTSLRFAPECGLGVSGSSSRLEQRIRGVSHSGIFRWVCCVDEEVAAVCGLYLLGCDGAGAPQAFERPSGEFAQDVFELGEGLFDRVEIGAVGREKPKLGSGGFNRDFDGGALVSAEVVHDHDVAGAQRPDQFLFDVIPRLDDRNRSSPHCRSANARPRRCAESSAMSRAQTELV